MLFSSYAFLAFFAVVFPVYWGLKNHRWRMVWLLAASAVFYMSWNPWLITLILFSAATDYFAALALERVTRPGVRRLLLVASISINLGLLAFFKYVNFFLDNVRALGDWLGLPLHAPTLDILLPLGISFYTFETISYIVDVYRGRTRAVRNPLDYALFILFFPHLLAGPIVRPNDFLPQLGRPKRWNWSRNCLGARLFLIGFVKKTVLADHMAGIVEQVFMHPAQYSTLSNWAAVFAYLVQIYCDFSGYSDMAVGLAHLFGFKLPQNFRSPYWAVDMADFWRRWHISLSSWLRDYLYIGLGGSRGGVLGSCRNILIMMLLAGLWHGASWSFALWGLYNGVLMVLHRLTPWSRWSANPRFRVMNCALTLFLVGWGVVLFRAQSLANACDMYACLTGFSGGTMLKGAAVAGAFGCLVLVLAGQAISPRLNWERLQRNWSPVAVGAALAAVLVLTQLVLPSRGQVFIYFHF